jgi:hydroxymethylbilane synthase
VPAAGQGALAIEARSRTTGAEALDDPATRSCVTAERQVVHALGASCNTSVGAYARAAGEGLVELTVWVGRPDGSVWLSDRGVGSPVEVGRRVADRLLSAGAQELLVP